MEQLEYEYSNMVRDLKKSGEDILKTLVGHQATTLHMAVGISGEAGELLDAIKKFTIYNKTLDMENVIEELGDLEFYMEGLRQDLNITRDQTLKHNYDKLGIRYHSGRYSDKQAQERADKNGNN